MKKQTPAKEPIIRRRKLSDYLPDMSNANIGSERGLQMVEDSLSQDGVGRSIVADGQDRIPAGNKTLEAAMNAGIEDVIEIETDGRALIVHKRTDWDLTDPQGAARRYAYRDNRASELSLNWDAEQLLADINAGVDLSHLFTEYELDELLADLQTDTPLDDPGAQIDRASELAEQYGTAVGQVWQLGRHRLAIGDCANPATIESLMCGKKADMVFNDPPYGMHLDTDYDTMFSADDSHRKTGDRFDAVLGDDVDYDPRPVMKLFEGVPEQFWWGADYYLDKIPNVSNGVFVVWDKRCSDEMDKVVGNTYEMAWSKQKHKKMIARILWSGHHGMQNDDTKTRVHPTQKPVELARWFFDHWGKSGEIVVDTYLGSGTTLVAAEQTNRTCYACEIHPPYAAVAIQRWEALTGQKAALCGS